MRRPLLTALFLATILAIIARSYANYTFTTLNDPFGTVTDATGISGNTIVGYYSDGMAIYGFSETNNVYTTLTTPLAPTNYIEPWGIQGNTIVGTYYDGTNAQGFTETGGVYTTITYPL